MSVVSSDRISPEVYLTNERTGEARHEYRHGEVIEMVGGSREQNRIVFNLGTCLTPHLNDGFTFFGLDMRVNVNATGLYTYPDFMIVEGEGEFEDLHADTLLNPIVIAEVLSPSTERYDRVQKFEHYKAIETFREYLLISQDQPRIEQFVRNDVGDWTVKTLTGIDAKLELKSISCNIPLTNIYYRVKFNR